MKKITPLDIKNKKGKEKIVALTAYDYFTAKILDELSIDIILVGDSLGMVMLGYENTLPVTMEEMIHHTKAVTKAVQSSLVVGDMPFMSYQLSDEEALRNASRFIKEGGAAAVKLEGGKLIINKVKMIVEAGIPVLGHIGLTPQQILTIGGYKVQGKEPEIARKIIDDAKELTKAGCFAIVLECVPTLLAKQITESINIPTIGIGAGKYCDGQILVTHDLLGITKWIPKPKYVKNYTNMYETIKQAIGNYKQEVLSGIYPDEEHSY
jgi:3-methyl-2-oxobutanoate hydroxymethyltransferase